MVKDYLNTLKNKGNFKFAELSKMSGVPEATIRRIFSGDTPDARFDTVARIIVAMGGSMDDAFSTKKEKDIEANVVTELKSGFEIRIEDLRERLDEMRERETKAGRIIKALAITVAVLVAVIIVILGIAITSHGWVQY